MQRALRLRKQGDFQHLRTKGKNWRHPALILSLDHNALPHNRYGFIVSKRLGNAVMRNRVRRQLQACLRNLHGGLSQGYDMAFIARQPIKELTFTEIREAVESLLMRASLLESPNL